MSDAPRLPNPANPILVEITRGSIVESFHTGAAAVVSASGTVVDAWGEIDRPIYARSAIKPIQALPLVETGAADRFALSQAHLALACASHNGDDRHVGTVRAWLTGLGFDDGTLECGAHLPYDEDVAHAMIRSGERPTAAHNNCSGKHSGFLSVCRHLGEDPAGYVTATHPAMRRVATVLSEMTETDVTEAPHGVDGCGIPVIGVGLRATAHAIARMADPVGLGGKRAEAARRLSEAMMAEPHMVAGRNRFCTTVMAAVKGAAFVKTGAEGVFIGGIPARGLGIALKIDDGAGRAAEVAMAALLQRYGVIDNGLADILSSTLNPAIANRAGLTVGHMRSTL